MFTGMLALPLRSVFACAMAAEMVVCVPKPAASTM
jgi:hypothetical protein